MNRKHIERKGYIEPHLIFSYWIFAFFIVYELGFIEYNPKVLIVGGLVENLISIMFILYFNSNFRILLIFLLNMVFTKFIPLYYLWKTNVKSEDYYFSLFFILLYLAWLGYNGTDVVKVYNDIIYSIVKNENRSPFYWLVNKIGL